MFKKVVCLFFCVVFAVSAIGCSDKKGDSSSTPSFEKIGDIPTIDCTADEWTDDNGDGNFSFPYINIDTDAARRINSEIADLQQEVAESEEYYSFSNYTAEVYKALLSVIITVTDKASKTSYYVYNLELVNGTVPSALAIADYAGYSEKEYNDAIYEYHDVAFDDYFGAFKSKGAGYETQREKTMSKENLALAKPFVTSKGRLGAVVTLQTLGGSSATHLITDTANGLSVK